MLGSQLLISNGKQVFAEGTTGPDGVWLAAFKDLPRPADVSHWSRSYKGDDVRVFARSGGMSRWG